MLDSVWRKPAEELQPGCTVSTLKYRGENINVWGHFSYNSVDVLVFIHEIMSSEVYKGIVNANLQESTNKLLKQ